MLTHGIKLRVTLEPIEEVFYSNSFTLSTFVGLLVVVWSLSRLGIAIKRLHQDFGRFDDACGVSHAALWRAWVDLSLRVCLFKTLPLTMSTLALRLRRTFMLYALFQGNYHVFLFLFYFYSRVFRFPFLNRLPYLENGHCEEANRKVFLALFVPDSWRVQNPGWPTFHLFQQLFEDVVTQGGQKSKLMFV